MSDLITGISSGNLSLMETAHGQFIPMYKLTKFFLDDVNANWPHSAFPAFVVDGVEKDEIYISQFTYPCVAGTEPKVDVSLEDARLFAKGFGTGFHLLTAWEWAAVAWIGREFWGRERGNTEGLSSVNNGIGSFTYRMPMNWYGIWGMTGNNYEYTDGIEFRANKIYGLEDNSFLKNTYSDSQDDSVWTELATVNADGFSEKEITQTGIVGDMAKYLLLVSEVMGKLPRGKSFYQNSTNASVLERGGAYHSGDDAGLFCFRAMRDRLSTRPDSSFRVAYIA